MVPGPRTRLLRSAWGRSWRGEAAPKTSRPCPLDVRHGRGV